MMARKQEVWKRAEDKTHLSTSVPRDRLPLTRPHLQLSPWILTFCCCDETPDEEQLREEIVECSSESEIIMVRRPWWQMQEAKRVNQKRGEALNSQSLPCYVLSPARFYVLKITEFPLPSNNATNLDQVSKYMSIFHSSNWIPHSNDVIHQEIPSSPKISYMLYISKCLHSFNSLRIAQDNLLVWLFINYKRKSSKICWYKANISTA